jgi:hypothetical protein
MPNLDKYLKPVPESNCARECTDTYLEYLASKPMSSPGQLGESDNRIKKCIQACLLQDENRN